MSDVFDQLTDATDCVGCEDIACAQHGCHAATKLPADTSGDNEEDNYAG